MRRALSWLEHHAILFVVLGLAGLTALWLDVKAQSVTQETLRIAALRGCHRLNTDRARENRGWLHAYKASQGTLSYDNTFRSLILVSLKHPTQRVTAEQRKNTTLFLAKLGGEIAGVEQNLAGIEWTPLTKCYPATLDPLHYLPPEPQPLAVTVRYRELAHGRWVWRAVVVQNLPPPSALAVGAGE